MLTSRWSCRKCSQTIQDRPSDQSTSDTGLGDGRDLRSMSDNKRSINPQEESEQSTSDEEPESSYSGNQCIGSEKCSIAKDRPRRVDVRPP